MTMGLVRDKYVVCCIVFFVANTFALLNAAAAPLSIVSYRIVFYPPLEHNALLEINQT